jgi:hypothetical protein
MRKTYIQQYLSQHACITIVQFGMVSFTWRPFVWTYSDPLAQGYSIYPILDRNGVISNHRNLHTIFLRGCDVEKDVHLSMYHPSSISNPRHHDAGRSVGSSYA